MSKSEAVTESVLSFFTSFVPCSSLLQESDLINLGTGSYSWFLVNGYGCKATYSDNITAVDDPYRPRRPEIVENCLLDYSLVEVLHSGVQCLLAVSL